VRVARARELNCCIRIRNTCTELYQSGVFFGWKHLHKTIRTCKRVGLIVLDRLEIFDWDKSIGRRRTRQWWCITSFGLNFLKFFDNEEHPWRIQKFKNRSVRQVVVS